MSFFYPTSTNGVPVGLDVHPWNQNRTGYYLLESYLAGTLMLYILVTSSSVAGSCIVKLNWVVSPITEAGSLPHPVEAKA